MNFNDICKYFNPVKARNTSIPNLCRFTCLITEIENERYLDTCIYHNKARCS